VVVTGLGVVSPIGIGKENFWKNTISGECDVDHVTRFDVSSYPYNFAAEVKDFQAPDIIGPKAARRLSRGTQFVIVSTQKALEDAQIDLHKEDPYQVGLCVSTSLGPADI
jgi:3-oxoacyl-[acyl-carrier-protein] synthase II